MIQYSHWSSQRWITILLLLPKICISTSKTSSVFVVDDLMTSALHHRSSGVHEPYRFSNHGGYLTLVPFDINSSVPLFGIHIWHPIQHPSLHHKHDRQENINKIQNAEDQVQTIYPQRMGHRSPPSLVLHQHGKLRAQHPYVTTADAYIQLPC